MAETQVRPALLAAALLLAAVGCDPMADAQAPTVTIVSPRDRDSLYPVPVTVKAVARDNRATSRVTFFLDGDEIGTDHTGDQDTFTIVWEAQLQPAGTAHELGARAWDLAGNYAYTEINVFLRSQGGGGGGPTIHTLDIVGGDSVWLPAGNPHVVTRDLSIRDSGRLFIAAGCTLKFLAGAALTVGLNSPGELRGVGTAASPVLFTSGASAPAPGDWLGLRFCNPNSPGSRLSFSHLEFTGASGSAAVSLFGGATVAIDNCRISDCAADGLYVDEWADTLADFSYNSITACAGCPVSVPPAIPPFLSPTNNLFGNSQDAVRISAGVITRNCLWPHLGLPYLVGGTILVGHSTPATLTIAASATVGFGSTGAGISVGTRAGCPGGLIADGYSGLITFASARPAPARGDWAAIEFGPDAVDSLCRLHSCRLEYGGGNGKACIIVSNARPTITNNQIGRSAAWGIWLEGAEYPDPALLESRNSFYDNYLGNVRYPPAP